MFSLAQSPQSLSASRLRLSFRWQAFGGRADTTVLEMTYQVDRLQIMCLGSRHQPTARVEQLQAVLRAGDAYV